MLASSTLGDYSRCIIVGVFSDYIGLVAVLVAENGDYIVSKTATVVAENCCRFRDIATVL